MTQTIYSAKEQAIADTPLLLFDFTFSDGVTVNWSTHTATVNGVDYSARILRQNVFDVQMGSDLGVDTIPKITVELANADSYVSEIERSIGVKGAQLTVSLVFYSFSTAAASSSTQVLFKGILDPPESITEEIFRVSASNRLSLQRVVLPETRIQKRCPWAFPQNSAQRAEAVAGGTSGAYSRFFKCGYSPDQTGGVGNFQSGNQPFTSCGYTRADCSARGMFSVDALSRTTARFGGIEFVPPTVLVRSAGEKGSHYSPVDDNLARYNDFVPLVYGTAWFNPSVVFSRNDGNLTRFELLLGMGQIQGIQKVLVNSVEIPVAENGKNMTGTGWYSVVSAGTRSGAFDLNFTDAQGNPLGDPYGSMAYLSVVVPNAINDGSSLPDIQVLVDGLLVEQFDANGQSLGTSFSNNPAWVILDLLRRTGWSLSEVDFSVLANTAAYCAEQIQTTDLFGNAVVTPRFQCNLVLKNRRAASDVMRGIRNGSRLFLRYGPNALLQLMVENSLALQQPDLPPGSNAQYTLNGGWAAYEFGDGTNGTTGIARTGAGASSVRLSARSTADTPNRFVAEFQDAFNEYQQDSMTVSDADDITAMGQEITSTTPVLGLPHYDQAGRILQFCLSKSIHGNTTVQFQTSIKALGLAPGDIIALTYRKEGFDRQPFRITRIQPGANYRTAVITATIHSDDWYYDTNGQTPGDASRRQGNIGINLPRPLGGVTPDDDGVLQFAVTEASSQSPDGTAIVTATAGFAAPRSASGSGPEIPFISLIPTVSASGGTLLNGQSFYYAVSSVGADSSESLLSFLVYAPIETGTNTSTVTLGGLAFPPTAASFNVYRGDNPSNLTQIAATQPLGKTFVDPGLPATSILPPDPNYDHADFYWRLELQPETPATIFTATTIGSSELEMQDGEYTGMIVRLTQGPGSGQEAVVAGNTVDTLTLETAWRIQPDSTSLFVIAQNTFQFGAMAQTSPVQFAIPNQAGNIIHISGRAANANGLEAPYETSPLTRYKIGGAGIKNVDAAPPAMPNFGLTVPDNAGGTVLFGAVSFDDLTNTSTVTAGTYCLYYRDEMNLGAAASLATAMVASDTAVTVSASLAGLTPFYVLIDTEILQVTDVDSTGTQLTVARGMHGTTAAAHASGAPIYLLLQNVCVVPFVRDFFGTPASGDWSYALSIPNVRIISAELTVRNSQGDSPTGSQNFTNFGGLRTLSGGQLSFQISGFLAIAQGAAPDIVVDAPKAVRDVYAIVKQAPVDSPVVVNLNVNGSLYCTLTIAAGAVNSGQALDGSSLGPLHSGDLLSIDVAGVGLTKPGSDLTVIVRV